MTPHTQGRVAARQYHASSRQAGHDPRPIERTISDLIALFRDTKRLKGRRDRRTAIHGAD